MNDVLPLSAFFTRFDDAGKVTEEAFWRGLGAWVTALGLQLWIMTDATPHSLWRCTQLLVVEETRSGVKTPVHIMLEVLIRQGLRYEGIVHRVIDANGIFNKFVDGHNWSNALVPVPFGWIGFLEGRLGQLRSPSEQRALDAGFVRDLEMSERLALALTQTYGPFSSEWLISAAGGQMEEDEVSCASEGV